MRRAQREEPQMVFTQAPVDYITGWTPVERTDTIVYNWADYPLEARRAYELYGWWRELYIAQEREHEAAIEEALEEYDTLRERARRLNPIANGVTLVSEREYAQMERNWMLDPNMIYYTYPDTDDGLTVNWTERHPKIVKVTYFIE